MTDDYDLDSGPDPAGIATEAPENREEGRTVVYAVGIGPGNLEYLTPRGERAIAEADVVVGFSTVIDFVADRTDADLLPCDYRDEADALATFGERVDNGETGTAVLMGDPNHSGYQFVGKVERAVREATSEDGSARTEATPVRVIPGISSVQVAASRARTPMEDTEFVTLHKSGDLDPELARLADAVMDRHLLVLPRPFDLMPGDVARFLIDNGADPELESLVLERLTHENEAMHRFTLDELSEYAGSDGAENASFSDLSVLAVRQPV